MMRQRKSVTFDESVREAEEAKRFEDEQNMLNRKQKLMEEMRHSHKVMQDKSGSRKSIKMNDVQMNLDELDLHLLTKE